MTDFSQSGEQATILEWADRYERAAGHQGRWLDLGGADGISASNTRALALRGWAGVAVEPGAVQFDKLVHLYRDRPDVECVQAAVVQGAGMPFLTLPEGASVEDAEEVAQALRHRSDAALVVPDGVTVKYTGPSSLVRFHYSHDLVSTTEQANAETWAELADFTPVYVAAVTVQQLLATLPGPYDMVSIDTEGTSLELFAELRRLEAFALGALVVVEAEDGTERWEIQTACVEGWARLGVTPNNVLLEHIRPNP